MPGLYIHSVDISAVTPHSTCSIFSKNWGSSGHGEVGFFHDCLPRAVCISIDHIQFNSATQSCLTLCDPMDCSTPGPPVHHQLMKFTQIHVHPASDAIQPSYPLLSPSPPASNLSQNQGLFQWVKSLHEVAKVLEFQLQRQSFQWTPRTDLL